jgi:oxygen-dependent protoporphyrinogen oxidase
MAVRRDQVDHPLDGFGFVVPIVENRSLIAVTFSSVKFDGRAPQEYLLLRAFLGGALQPEIYEMSDDQMQEAVLRDLRNLIGLKGAPEFSELYRWPLSMPQYPVGHLHHVDGIHDKLSRWPGLTVAGNGYSGVGIPDCVNSGEQAAEALLQKLTGEEVDFPTGNLQPTSTS